MPDHFTVSRALFRLYERNGDIISVCAEGSDLLSSKSGADIEITISKPKYDDLFGQQTLMANIIDPMYVGTKDSPLMLLGKMIVCEPAIIAQLE